MTTFSLQQLLYGTDRLFISVFGHGSSRWRDYHMEKFQGPLPCISEKTLVLSYIYFFIGVLEKIHVPARN